MNDFEKMKKNIGNNFNLVLVASERMRELRRERKLQEELIKIDNKYHNIEEMLFSKKKNVTLHEKTFNEIESGVTGKEYLTKIKHRYVSKKLDKKT